MNHTKLTYLVLFLVAPFFYACQCTPQTSVMTITQFNNVLYTSTLNHGIRTFDIETKKWGKIDSDAGVAWEFIKDGDTLIFKSRKHGVVRVENDETISRVFDLPKEGIVLIGADNDFFYLQELTHIFDSDQRLFHFSGLKYSKKNTLFIDNHFEHTPNLIITNICEDDDFYWFVCFDVSQQGSGQKRSDLLGPIVLVSKSKKDGSINEYRVDDQTYTQVGCINGSDSIWLFVLPESRCASWQKNKRLYKFSKNTKAFEQIDLQTFKCGLQLIPNQYISDENHYVWTLMARKNHVVRIDIRTMQTKAFQPELPPDIQLRKSRSRRRPTSNVYSDEKFLWFAATKVERYGLSSRGTRVPYLVRVSKDDMSYKLIKMKPTTPEAIGIFFDRYILKTVLYPFEMLAGLFVNP